MKETVLKVFTFAIGCVAALVCIFYFVSGIICLTNLGDADGKWIVYLILIALLDLAAAAGMGYGAFVIVKGFLASEDKKNVSKFLMLVAFCECVLGNLIFICFGGYESGWAWALLVLAAIGLVAILLAMFANFNDKVKFFLHAGAAAWGFVLSIVLLANAGGISIALYVFMMFMFLGILGYSITELVFDNTGNSSKKETNE